MVIRLETSTAPDDTISDSDDDTASTTVGNPSDEIESDPNQSAYEDGGDDDIDIEDE